MIDPLIAQIPESDKELHCPCHANTYEHKKSAHERQAYEYGAEVPGGPGDKGESRSPQRADEGPSRLMSAAPPSGSNPEAPTTKRLWVVEHSACRYTVPTVKYSQIEAGAFLQACCLSTSLCTVVEYVPKERR